MMSDELKPCRECGSPCQVEVFDCVHGQATLWLCSQHTWLGGRCPSNTAYLTEDAWNQRTTPATDSTELEARLRVKHSPQCNYILKPSGSLVNPDGPEAADTLASYRAEIAQLRDKLARTEAAFQAGVKAGLEAAAKLCEARMEERFAEYGTREPDTNATYYSGRYGETLETLDEENESIVLAIRAIDPTSIKDTQP